MIKIRVRVLEKDVPAIIEKIKNNFEVLYTSGPYYDKHESKYVRYYFDVEFSGQTSDRDNKKKLN